MTVKEITRAPWRALIKATVREYAMAGWDRLLGYAPEKSRFSKAHGYPLNLKNPTSFSEKLVWKKLYDRNPLLPPTADKYEVRAYVRERLGKERAEQLLIPLLFVTEDPARIPWHDLPDQFVVKSSYGSARVRIVTDKRALDIGELTEKLWLWRHIPYGVHTHEWAYQGRRFPRRILVEPLLASATGAVPEDYKFFMIGGECVGIKVDTDRTGEFASRFYNTAWEPLDIRWNKRPWRDVPEPECLDTMVELAGTLAEPLDFVRVDFYVVDGKPLFGEMTHYPMKGRGRIEPTSVDYEWGRQWHLPNRALRGKHP